jgi:manganese/zinc/iron transport system ATP- binding protein
MIHFPYSHRHHAEAVTGALALEVQDLRVVYPKTRQLVLKNLTLYIPVGQRVALVGHNGAGKSTLLKTVAGLLKPQQGTLKIYGLQVGECHHRVAYLPQRGEIEWRFPVTLRRLVMTGRYVHLGWLRPPRQSDHQIVQEVLARLGLSDLAERQIGQLSGGQQQRALIARALAQESDLLLLDEPFNAVDVASRTIIMRVLDEIQQQGKTALIATHDLNRLSTDFDHVVRMSEGQLEETNDA